MTFFSLLLMQRMTFQATYFTCIYLTLADCSHDHLSKLVLMWQSTQVLNFCVTHVALATFWKEYSCTKELWDFRLSWQEVWRWLSSSSLVDTDSAFQNKGEKNVQMNITCMKQPCLVSFPPFPFLQLHYRNQPSPTANAGYSSLISAVTSHRTLKSCK
jgi:hypothetical protein